MSEYISVLRRQPEDIRAGAAPFAVYVDGELWCECEDYFSVAEKLAALLPERGAADESHCDRPRHGTGGENGAGNAAGAGRHVRRGADAAALSAGRGGLLYMEGAHSRGLEQNRQFRGQWYYGRLLIVGVAPYGVRFRSLTPEQIAMYMAKWREAVVPYEKVRWPG